MFRARERELVEQMQELEGLRGKNATVIRQMRLRIEQEQADFDASGARIQAVRSVHLKLLKELFGLLGASTLKGEVAQFSEALKQPGIKLGIKRTYGECFARLRDILKRAQKMGLEIQNMLGTSFKNLNAEFGFSLQPPPAPELKRYHEDLTLIERNHLQYLGLSNTLKLAQPEFGERLARALMARLKSVFDAALNDVEVWNKSAAAQLDGQLRERRRNFARRIEAVSRIQKAAGGLDERIRELEQSQASLDATEAKLAELCAQLLEVPEPAADGAAAVAATTA